jgi:lipopolysaccharide/colanic/teichoic acid biosynthesis glycosyltransferase
MEEGAKRLMDVALAAGALLAAAPLLAITALIIRLMSGGPVLYAGARVGADGQIFRMYKFRTMVINADGAGPPLTHSGDARVTPVGRLLRATKIDELPQLLNVLKGEMSLVGPRPEAPRFVQRYSEVQRTVLTVKPGITGPAQIAYRDEERLIPAAHAEEYYCTVILPRKLQLDLEYVQHHSVRGDLDLLFSTIFRLLWPRRAVSRGS